MLIFRSNYVITASGIVTLRKERVTIPDNIIIQFDLLKMSMVLVALNKCMYE